MINKEDVQEYQDLTNEVTKLETELNNKQQEFNLQHKYIIDNITTHKDRLNELQKEIKQQALDEFKETGNKKLTAGLGIQTRVSYTYNDNEAIEWCKENMKVAVSEKLNVSMFKKYAKDNALDFVTINSEDKVTWPTKGLNMEVQ